MDIDILLENPRAERAVIGFSGWGDAGGVVEYALSELQGMVPTEPCAVWDLDGFWHAESSRPDVRVRHGRIQTLEWPTFKFFLCRPPGPGIKPFIFGFGQEPSTDWRRFTLNLLRFLSDCGCRELLLAGSFYDNVLHEEAMLSAVVQDPEGFNSARDLGCGLVEYGGPCSIHSPIMESAPEAGLRAISFWAHFPVYLKAPHEKLVSRMLRALGFQLGLELDTHHLDTKWQAREKEIENLILHNVELGQAVERAKKREHPSQPGHKPNIIDMGEFLRRRQDPDVEDNEPGNDDPREDD